MDKHRDELLDAIKDIEAVEPQKQGQMEQTTRLALEVQLSIARLDRLQDTMKLVSELCEQITGIAYPIDLDEHHRTYQEKRKQQVKCAVEAPKKQSGRPKGTARVGITPKKENSQRNTEIRKRFFQDGVSQTELVKETGLSPTTISNIIHRKAGQP